MKYQVRMSFEEVELPPFSDVLIVGKYCPHGKNGLNRCLELLAPGRFELISLEEDLIEAVFISRKLLTKMPADKIIARLKRKVFPHVSGEELIRVEFSVRVTFN